LATVTFKVTTLPLPLLKKKKERSYRYNYFKKVMSNFALQTATTIVKKGQ